MRPETRSVRGLVLMLIAGLVFSSSGCVTAERRANRFWNRVSEGMSREDVRERLGEADSHSSSQGTEIWHYSYGPRPDPAKIARIAGQTLGILTVIGGCFLLMAYANAGTTPQPDFGRAWPDGDGSASSSTVHFRVVFDGAGKVRSISGIEPCDD